MRFRGNATVGGGPGPSRRGWLRSIGVDLENYKKFPRLDDTVTYKKVGRDLRGEIGASSAELPDYSGPSSRRTVTPRPASLIETAKIYNPNMKVDILAIPPCLDKDDVCCKSKLP